MGREVEQQGPIERETDGFGGGNQGLVTAEVETSQQDAATPDWAGEQVTGDSRYYNRTLVQHPYPKWAEKEK